MRLVCVTMKAENWHHYTDTIQALDYCFNTYTKTAVTDQTDLALRLKTEYSEMEGIWNYNRRVSGWNFFLNTEALVDVKKDGSLADWTEKFVPAESVELGIAPYDFYTGQCGTVEYYDGERFMGSVPVYMALPKLTSGDRLSMQTRMSNARLIEMLQEKDQTTATARDSVDSAAGMLYERLNQLEISPMWLGVIAVAVIIAMFLLSLLWQMFRRKRRRRNYERLRKKRLEEKQKESEK